ncbi:MAG TPA: heavy metal translocating P-type ATPase [Alphaproteobacteria bacterium]|nr:heavy metal translocating P-type ATPase [Alphaproteobacteria bacterium]
MSPDGASTVVAPGPAPGVTRAVPVDDARTDASLADGESFALGSYIRETAAGRHALDFMVEGVHCGGCVAKIERALAGEPGVTMARVNLSTRRLAVEWSGAPARGSALAAAVEKLGFGLVPYDPVRLADADKDEEKALLRAMAVAGFAAANVMLLSVSIWAGHFQDMGAATRALMHWFSALIALPAILYAGRPFFGSALSALKALRTNMDVPISLAVLLASAVSLHETLVGGPHAYFDSAITLLFFLLVGRYLDRRARGRAREAGTRLLALRAKAVTVLSPDGTRRALPPDQVLPGMSVLIAAGERIGADGRIISGASEIDQSLITGEALAQSVGIGDQVFAGTLNGSGALTISVTGAGEDTLLAEIARLMEAAEQRRARYVALADRVARLYAPVVHGLALATFLGWWIVGGLAWQPALLIAVAVLVITCPCALGLAVPAVQVIASGRLLRHGVLLKSATALERLAQVDTVVFDKTGTLTTGTPALTRDPAIDDASLHLAASMAGASRHPLARALAGAVPDAPVAHGVAEEPGRGLSLQTATGEVRLGSRSWCGISESDDSGPELWLARPNAEPIRFGFSERLRDDAEAVVAALQARGLGVELLSGDRPATVAAIAGRLNITCWRAAQSPADKCARLAELADAGRRVLMVGDGLNDAPALAAAHVSLSPSSAADLSQTAADAVFQGARLAPVLETLAIARRAGALVRQNFGLAFGYNLLAIPVAIAGMVTPLIAALAMSASSIAVIGNALRLAGKPRKNEGPR